MKNQLIRALFVHQYIFLRARCHFSYNTTLYYTQYYYLNDPSYYPLFSELGSYKIDLVSVDILIIVYFLLVILFAKLHSRTHLFFRG